MIDNNIKIIYYHYFRMADRGAQCGTIWNSIVKDNLNNLYELIGWHIGWPKFAEGLVPIKKEL